MSFSKKIISFFISVALLAALLIPAIIHTHHALVEHEVQSCDTNTNTHFHETQLHCDFHDYQLASVYYFEALPTLYFTKTICNTLGSGIYVSSYTLHKNYFSLRGPPVIS